MANYAVAADCEVLFKLIWNHVDEADADDYIDLAHDWLIDSIRPFFIPPATSTSKLLVLAEANYAMYLMFRADNETIKSLGFQQESYRLLNIITTKANVQAAATGGPASSSYRSGRRTQPTFTQSKFDSDGKAIGDVSGISSDNVGSLDDF